MKKLANIKLILYIVLLLKLTTCDNVNEENPLDKDFYNECNRQNIRDISSIKENVCVSVNTSFKSKRNKCCRLTISFDLLDYKNQLPDFLKEKIVDGTLTDEDLKELAKNNK